MAIVHQQFTILAQLRAHNSNWLMIEPGYYTYNADDAHVNDIQLLEFDSDSGDVLYCGDNNPRCFLHDVTCDNNNVVVFDDAEILMFKARELRAALNRLAALGRTTGTLFEENEFVGQMIPLSYAYSAACAMFDESFNNPIAPWVPSYDRFFGPEEPEEEVIIEPVQDDGQPLQ